MPDASAELLIGLGATTFAATALCFVLYEISAAKERLHRRIDILGFVPQHLPRPVGDKSAAGQPANALVTTTPRREDLQLARWLAPLRLDVRWAPRLLLGLRLLMAAILSLALALVGYADLGVTAAHSLFALGLLGGAFGWVLPRVVMDRMAENRRRAIAHGLADAIELLVISVEAGLSLEEGISRIVGELRRAQPAMAEELALTSADLRILPSRDEALRRLAERVNLPSVRSVVTTLSQTLKYGTPLAQALRVVAAELRNNDLLKLEEQANRLPVLLTVPMIVFILPSIFLIIGGPAFLKILDIFVQR